MQEIQISHGQVSLQVPVGSPIYDFIKQLFPGNDSAQILACKANGIMTSLHAPLLVSSNLEAVKTDDPAAPAILRRSLCFLLSSCASRLFPGKTLTIGHAIDRGFFYYFAEGPLSAAEFNQLEQGLAALVSSRRPLQYVRLAWSQALAHLEAEARPDAAELLRHHNEPIVSGYELDGFLELDRGVLAAWTDQLGHFHLSRHGDGFIIEPGEGQSATTTHPKPSRSALIFSTYQEYKRWGEILGLSTVGQLNSLIGAQNIKDFIWVAEALHQQKIAQLASHIAQHSQSLKMVLIAGPSSSGKTTFAKKMSIQLTVSGLRPIALSLDDYFVERTKTPRDADGNYDFEHLQALDLDLLNEHLLRLFEGQEIELPSFDFKAGVRKYTGKKMRLPPGGILIAEGIHGLNEALTAKIPATMKYRIYASALTQLKIDRLNRISTTDNRLLRRMVRDNRYRGHSADATLRMWPSVRRGENRNIFPFQDSADGIFNSALDYELGVLKPYAEPLLESVSPASPHYHEARRLLQFLGSFLPIPAEIVPDNSILREFIGGSAFKY